MTFIYLENDQISSRKRLSERGINILILRSTFGNSSNERFTTEHFFHFENRHAMLPL